MQPTARIHLAYLLTVLLAFTAVANGVTWLQPPLKTWEDGDRWAWENPSVFIVGRTYDLKWRSFTDNVTITYSSRELAGRFRHVLRTGTIFAGHAMHAVDEQDVFIFKWEVGDLPRVTHLVIEARDGTHVEHSRRNAIQVLRTWQGTYLGIAPITMIGFLGGVVILSCIFRLVQTLLSWLALVGLPNGGAQAEKYVPLSHKVSESTESRVGEVGTSDLIRDRKEAQASMTARGWCPHQAHYFGTHLNKTGTALMSFMKDLKPLEDMSMHENCFETQACSAYTVDMSDYTTKHVDKDCSCSMVYVPQDKLLNILRAGGIPIVSIKDMPEDWPNGQRQVRLDVRSAYQGVFSWERMHPYIAISHVWKDGLGNPAGNGLPSCQLLQIQRFVADQGQDTVCAPSIYEPRVPRIVIFTSARHFGISGRIRLVL